MALRVCDELASGFGWIAPEPARLERASHALAADGRVWLFDPVDVPGVEERIRALGEPAGVVQLLDRHGRDCALLARRLGVRHHEVPFEGVAGAPFELVPLLRRRLWREVAAWWPGERILVLADALGTARYFPMPGDRLGVHPLLRLRPPLLLRDLSRGLTPRHVLCGHGEGIHGPDAALALEQALASARRGIPRWALGQLKGAR